MILHKSAIVSIQDLLTQHRTGQLSEFHRLYSL